MRISLAFLLFFVGMQLSAQQAILNGHVYGYDGKPMMKAQITVYHFGSYKTDNVVNVAPNGSFSVSFPKNGMYKLQITGMNHDELNIPYIVEKSQREELEIQLSNVAAPARIDSVIVVDALNNFNRSSAKRMTLKDGMYRVSAPSPLARYPWRVLIYGEGQTNGQPVMATATNGEDYEVRSGSFTTVQNASTRPDLAFDASILSKSKVAMKLSSANKQLQRNSELFTEMSSFKKTYDESMEQMMSRHKRNGGNQSNFDMKSFNESLKVGQVEESIRARMKTETDSTSLRMLYLYYLSLPYDKRDAAICEKALKVVSPASDLWAIDPQLMYVSLNNVSASQKEDYINAVMAVNNNENVVVPIAYSELVQASVMNLKTRQREVYKVIADKFPTHPLASAAKLYLNPDRQIQPGSKMPSFSYIVGTKDKEKKLNLESLKGKYTLLDLRTDYCSACDQTTRTIMAQCQENSGKTLQILAMSLGRYMPELKEETKGKVTLTPALFTKETENSSADIFEFVGYPWRILIGPDLTILACCNDLNEEHFAASIRQVLH